MMRCAICREPTRTTAHSDWENDICDKCWRRSSPITRGYLTLCQQLGEEFDWPERYVMENNILWDLIVAQIRQSFQPPPERKKFDPRKVRVDMSKGRLSARRLMRERERHKP